MYKNIKLNYSPTNIESTENAKAFVTTLSIIF